MRPLKYSPNWLAPICRVEGELGTGPDAGPLATSTALMNRLSVAPSYVTARWLHVFAGRRVALQTVAVAKAPRKPAMPQQPEQEADEEEERILAKTARKTDLETGREVGRAEWRVGGGG